MKKILSLLGIITLIWTSTTSLVACNTQQEYTTEKLEKLKEEKNINIKTSGGKDGVLEWIVSQEKPFNKVDDKWYYVVWRANNEDNWRLIKFQNNKQNKLKNKDEYDKYKLALVQDLDWYSIFDLTIQKGNSKWIFWHNRHNNSKYFKAVYRWNPLDKTEPDLVIDDKGNVKVK